MMLIGHREFAGLEQILQTYQSNKFRAAILSHHGKAGEACGRHAIHHHSQGFLRKRHDWRVCYYLRKLNIPMIALALAFYGSKKIIASHHAEQMLIAVNHRVDPLAARIVIVG